MNYLTVSALLIIDKTIMSMENNFIIELRETLLVTLDYSIGSFVHKFIIQQHTQSVLSWIWNVKDK